MSDKERTRRSIVRAVCIQAWRLIKRASVNSLSLAFKLAWQIIRLKTKFYFSKVRGVTFDQRQKILMRLALYPSKDVRLSFVREPHNPFDPKAIKVVAEVKGKGAAMIGYVAKDLADRVTPEIDSGKQVLVMFEGITGSNKDLLGCNFSFSIF